MTRIYGEMDELLRIGIYADWSGDNDLRTRSVLPTFQSDKGISVLLWKSLNTLYSYTETYRIYVHIKFLTKPTLPTRSRGLALAAATDVVGAKARNHLESNPLILNLDHIVENKDAPVPGR